MAFQSAINQALSTFANSKAIREYLSGQKQIVNAAKPNKPKTDLDPESEARIEPLHKAYNEWKKSGLSERELASAKAYIDLEERRESAATMERDMQNFVVSAQRHGYEGNPEDVKVRAK